MAESKTIRITTKKQYQKQAKRNDDVVVLRTTKCLSQAQQTEDLLINLFTVAFVLLSLFCPALNLTLE